MAERIYQIAVGNRIWGDTHDKDEADHKAKILSTMYKNNECKVVNRKWEPVKGTHIYINGEKMDDDYVAFYFDDLVPMFDNWNIPIVINDYECNLIEEGKTWEIYESHKYSGCKVIAFGVYDDAFCVRVVNCY